MSASHPRNPVHHLIGGGIASLSAAFFLIRDAGVSGSDIRIYEQLDRVGGSLDGSGSSNDGYLVRGGRMFEKHFACTFDLLSDIPAVGETGISIAADIIQFNEAVRGSSQCRLVNEGKPADMDHLELSQRDILDLNRLMIKPERSLADRVISDCFKPSFFESNFWFMWSTMFSFQPWHSAMEMRRYLRRFIHLFPGFKRIEGILRTRYNQYDSLIVPIERWLLSHGVTIQRDTRVTDLDFQSSNGSRNVSSISIERHGLQQSINVSPSDRVYITLGSMTGSSSTGTNDSPPTPITDEDAAWGLWRRLASRFNNVGNPEKFCGDIERTRWESFTVTLANDAFFEFMEQFSKNVTGTGGLVTFRDSAWTLSIVMFHQPHFREQPDNRFVFWGYGLRGDRFGDFVRKPMSECTGLQLLDELAGQLRISKSKADFFEGAKVIPCTMPWITSQFMPRKKGDRPEVIPEGTGNHAFIGQFCEMPRDTVFTVEYSVRSAMTAVHGLTGKGHAPPSVHRSDLDPMSLARAAKTLVHG